MPSVRRAILLAVCCLCTASHASGEERVPRPEFRETDHSFPVNQHPAARSTALEYVDVAVLIGALALSAYLALGRRYRLGLTLLAVASIVYFGFYRKGCVCSVGSLQNVAQALFQPGFRIPVVVLAFFTLPLVFALLFGRVFCAAVCPFGAIQESVLVRPLRVPIWLDRPLRFLPHVYLGLAVLLAGTGSTYAICRYDPFVSMFRLSGSLDILVLTGCIVLLSVFIGRPYCRYLCPYGVLLNLCSRLSWRHATITPDECIRCRLCENSCPYGAIRPPSTERMGPERERERTVLAILLCLWPVLIAGGGWLGYQTRETLSRTNLTICVADALSREGGTLTVRQAHDERVLSPRRGGQASMFTRRGGGTLTDEEQDLVDGFRQTGRPAASLFSQANALKRRFAWGGAVMGAFLGLMLGLKLIGLTIRRRREDYEADRGICVSCGRCFEYCPREQVRLKLQRDERDEQQD